MPEANKSPQEILSEIKNSQERNFQDNLEEKCGGDAALREEVEKLIDFHNHAQTISLDDEEDEFDEAV